MRSPLLLAVLLAALLSGCLVEEPVPAGTQDTTQDGSADAASAPARQDAEPAPAQDEATAASAPHGTPARTDGAITTGTDPNQVPAAWARRSITITNGFGPATLGDLGATIAAGSITVQAGDRADYLVEANLEARSASEAEARALLERTTFVHEDTLDGEVLRLRERIEVEDPAGAPASPLDGIVDVGNPRPETVLVFLTITVPRAPAIQLDADSASGSLGVSDLHGPALDLSTASGSIQAARLAMGRTDLDASSGSILVDGLTGDELSIGTASGSIAATGLDVPTVDVDASSGSIRLAGRIDDLQASTASGSIKVEAAPAKSGTYDLDASSGSVKLALPDAGHAYHVDASTSSGSIDVDVPDAEVLEDEDRHVEVKSDGYDGAELATKVAASTASGSIDVAAE